MAHTAVDREVVHTEVGTAAGELVARGSVVVATRALYWKLMRRCSSKQFERTYNAAHPLRSLRVEGFKAAKGTYVVHTVLHKTDDAHFKQHAAVCKQHAVQYNIRNAARIAEAQRNLNTQVSK